MKLMEAAGGFLYWIDGKSSWKSAVKQTEWSVKVSQRTHRTDWSISWDREMRANSHSRISRIPTLPLQNDGQQQSCGKTWSHDLHQKDSCRLWNIKNIWFITQHRTPTLNDTHDYNVSEQGQDLCCVHTEPRDGPCADAVRSPVAWFERRVWCDGLVAGISKQGDNVAQLKFCQDPLCLSCIVYDRHVQSLARGGNAAGVQNPTVLSWNR